MRKRSVLFVMIVMLFCVIAGFAQQSSPGGSRKAVIQPQKVDTRIDNMGYWGEMARLGLVPVAPNTPVEPALYTGSRIKARSVVSENSPDVPLTTQNSTQSENSVFADPEDKNHVLNSNNSTQNPVGNLYGANDFYTFDGGATWGGQIQGAGGSNSGDPTTAISHSGRMYVNYISNNYGQGISYSDNDGQTWTVKSVAPNPGSMADKNHMWIDNALTSPYEGNLYVAWTNFGGSNDSEIGFCRSTNDGVNWSTPISISNAVNAGSHNQGVNLQTGPNGDVYAAWAIYDSWPSDETAIGFAKSTNGGTSFTTATRIITNIRGIRTTETHKNHRVNSFPSMTVDISNGPNQGNIYIVWANIGVPGVNTGSGIDVYMIKSINGGSTWSSPVRVNQDPIGTGKQHYFPWICCDPISGTLSVIFYDDRNVTQTKCEVFAANSTDGGQTWEDFKISDVSFTPSPIPGLAGGYMGDYLGITAQERRVYPVWSDNRTGVVMAYTSPFETGPPPNQPWITFKSFAVNNATGKLTPGITADLNVTLQNIGDQPADNVTATLTCESPFITILDGTAEFGNMAAGDSSAVVNAFQIQSTNNIPDATPIPFILTVTDGDSTWFSNFGIRPYAPSFTIGNMTVSDPLGNGNGILDPGETANLIVATTNSGGFEAPGTMANLACGNTYITLNTSTSNLDLVLPGETKNVVFSVTVSPDAPLNTPVTFNYSVTSGEYTAQKDFLKKIGLIVEDFESGDFTRFPWTFGGNSNWVISNVDPYEGIYSAKSGTISHNQTSELILQRNVTSPDSVSFYFKTSSEANYDYLKFFIDGNNMGQWAGDTPWTRAAFPVSVGNHTFKWQYMKDGSVNTGSDCAWVDFILLPTTIETGVNVSGTITYANTALTPLEELTVKLKNMGGTVIKTTTTNGSGIYTFTLVPPGHYNLEVTTTKPWGGVTAADVLLYRKHIANISFLTGIYLVSGDVNLSGTLSAVDVLLIKKRIANITNSFPSGNWVFNPGPFTVGTTNVTQDFNGLCYGDANASYIPAGTKSAAVNQGIVSLGQGSAAGNSVTVPVYLSDFNNLGALQFSIQYDPKQLKIKDITDWHSAFEEMTVGTNFPGILTFVWAANTSGIDLSDGILCNLHFITNTTEESALSFSSQPTPIEFSDYEGNIINPEFIDGVVKSAMGTGHSGSDGFTLYPNPGSGKFHLGFGNRTSTVDIKVVNAIGVIIYEEKDVNVMTTRSKVLDLENQPEGVYMLTIDDHHQIITEKLVINK